MAGACLQFARKTRGLCVSAHFNGLDKGRNERREGAHFFAVRRVKTAEHDRVAVLEGLEEINGRFNDFKTGEREKVPAFKFKIK